MWNLAALLTLSNLLSEKHLTWGSIFPVQLIPTVLHQSSLNLKAKISLRELSFSGKIFRYLNRCGCYMLSPCVWLSPKCIFMKNFYFIFSGFAFLMVALACAASIIDLFLQNNKEVLLPLVSFCVVAAIVLSCCEY